MATGPNYRPNIQLPNLMGHTGDPYDLNLYPQDMIWEKPEGWNESSLRGIEGHTAAVPEGMQETLSDASSAIENPPQGTATSYLGAGNPLQDYYQEEYPNKYAKSRLYYDREGMFSPKMQTQDPNAYYENVRSLGDEGNPWMGARDYVDAPFAKQSGNFYRDDYINYDEASDRPYQGDWSWMEGYSPDDIKGLRETDPMLMQALINQNTNKGIGAVDIQENITPEKLTITDEQRSGPVIESEEEAYINEGIKNPNVLQRMFKGLGNIFRGAGTSPAQQGYINRYGRNPTTGRMSSGPFRGQNLFGTSMFGSKTAKEQALKNLQKWGKTAPDSRVNQWENIVRGDRAQGTGTTVTGHGKSGMGRDPEDRMAYGGRAGYNTGGRVGILAAF